MNPSRQAVNAIFFINGFLHANLASRYPRVQDLFSLSNGSLGVVLLSSSVGAVMAMPFTGWLVTRNGSRTIGVVSAFSYAALFPMVTMVPGMPGLMALFFLIGVTAGMLEIAMNAQAVMVEKNIGRPIMTSFHALFSIGMAIGAFCGSMVEEWSIPLFTHLAIVAGASLLTAFWARYHLIHDTPERTDGGEPAFRLPNAAMVSIGVIAFCCMTGEGAMADWTTNYLERVVRAPAALAPMGLSAFALAMTFGRTIGDKARSRFGDRKLMVACGLISCAGIGTAIAFPFAYSSIIGFFLVGLGLSVIVPIAYSIAGNSKDVSPAVGLAMVTTMSYTGFLFGPPIIGFLADWLSLREALLFVAALFVTMTILSARYNRS